MYKIILPIRYIFNTRITWVATIAVALCVFTVVVVMTVLGGLVVDFKEKNHRFVGDCVVGTESLVGFSYYEEFADRLEKEDFIEATSPVVKSFALLTPGGTEKNVSVQMMGFDPSRHCQVTGFSDTLFYHKSDCAEVFSPGYDPNLAGFVAGIEMMSQRDAHGDYIHTIEPSKLSVAASCLPLTAKGGLAKAGAGLVNTKTFYFSDDSHSKLAKVDGSTIYLALEEAQRLCGMAGADSRISAIYIKFAPGVKLEQARDKVGALWKEFVQSCAGRKHANLLENVTVQTWKEYKREVIAPMEREQLMMTVVFILVGFITVFIVCVIFYMIVGHKTKDIGIMKSVGASTADVMGLFLSFAAVIGAIGAVFGAVGGWVFLTKINKIEDWLFENFKFQLWDRTIYAIGDIPNTIDWKVLSVIIVSAVAASLAGAFVPSFQAARREPIETLQVDAL